VPGARWSFTAGYELLKEDQYGLMMSWLAQLEGQGGRFYGYPLMRDWPAGTCRAAGATTSGAISPLQTTVGMNGLGAGATLLPGDFFSIANYLYCVTAPVTANGSGVGSVAFKPGARITHVISSPVTFFKPQATFKLTTDDTGLVFHSGNLADAVVDAEEAFV
jgi:hypothetical protein